MPFNVLWGGVAVCVCFYVCVCARACTYQAIYLAFMQSTFCKLQFNKNEDKPKHKGKRTRLKLVVL